MKSEIGVFVLLIKVQGAMKVFQVCLKFEVVLAAQAISGPIKPSYLRVPVMISFHTSLGRQVICGPGLTD